MHEQGVFARVVVQSIINCGDKSFSNIDMWSESSVREYLGHYAHILSEEIYIRLQLPCTLVGLFGNEWLIDSEDVVYRAKKIKTLLFQDTMRMMNLSTRQVFTMGKKENNVFVCDNYPIIVFLSPATCYTPPRQFCNTPQD